MLWWGCGQRILLAACCGGGAGEGDCLLLAVVGVQAKEAALLRAVLGMQEKVTSLLQAVVGAGEGGCAATYAAHAARWAQTKEAALLHATVVWVKKGAMHASEGGRERCMRAKEAASCAAAPCAAACCGGVAAMVAELLHAAAGAGEINYAMTHSVVGADEGGRAAAMLCMLLWGCTRRRLHCCMVWWVCKRRRL